MLELALLGYPQVSEDGQAISNFISNKALLLLCYLALNPKTHGRDQLAALFWGDMPEQKAKSNLRQALHNLNTLFPDYLDVTRQSASFLSEQAHQIDTSTISAAAQDAALDVTGLESAITLYRGEFLEGIYFEDTPELDDWLRVERERLRLAYIKILDRLKNLMGASQQWDKATGLAKKLLNVDPLNEETHQQLMLILARQGKYNEALSQYEQCQQILGDELGIEPAADTIQLRDRIQIARNTARDNLPLEGDNFVGRLQEQAQLDDWLNNPNCRLITLVGHGGIGKSRLARYVAKQYDYYFLNGIRYVPLAPVLQVEYVISTIAQAANAPLRPGDTRQQLLDWFSNQEMLLILDNFEHLMEARSLVKDILSSALDIKVLVTSREALNLQDEWVFNLSGFELPPEKTLHANVATQYESVQFFAQKMQQKQRDFVVSETIVDTLCQLCRLLEGHPLSLELASGILPYLSLQQIIEDIQSNLDVLSSEMVDASERHRSLRAVFQHSWSLLTVEEQSMFARLSVFRGGFSLEAAEQVAGATISLLEALSGKSMLAVLVSSDDDSTRYELHEVLRQYGAEILAEDETAQRALQFAHAEYFKEYLQPYVDSYNVQLPYKLKAMSTDLDNLRSAWHYATAFAAVPVLDQMLYSMHVFYEANNLFEEGSRVFLSTIEQLSNMQVDDEQELQRFLGRLHSHAAGMSLRLGQVPTAHQSAVKSVDLLRPTNAEDALAFALNIIGITHLYQGQIEEAQSALYECIDLYEKLDNRRNLVKPLANLGSLLVRHGAYDEAVTLLEQGHSICEELDDLHGMTHFLTNLGAAHQMNEDYERALHYYEEVLAIVDSLNIMHIKSVALNNLCELHVHLQQYNGAVDYGEQALVVLHDIGDQRHLALVQSYLGMAYCGLNDMNQAQSHISEAITTALETAAEPIMLGVLIAQATLLLQLGKDDDAVELLRIVYHHPVTEFSERRQAERLLSGIASDLIETPPDDMPSLGDLLRALVANND